MKDLSHLYKRKLNIIKSLLSPFDYDIKEIKKNSKGDLVSVEVNVEGKDLVFENNFFKTIPFGVQKVKIEEMVGKFATSLNLLYTDNDYVRVKYKDDENISYNFFKEKCTDKIPYGTFASPENIHINEIQDMIENIYTVTIPSYYRNEVNYLEYKLIKLNCNINCEYRNTYIEIEYAGGKEDLINELIKNFETKMFHDKFIEETKNTDSLYQIQQEYKRLKSQENQKILEVLNELFRDKAIKVLNYEYEKEKNNKET